MYAPMQPRAYSTAVQQQGDGSKRVSSCRWLDSIQLLGRTATAGAVGGMNLRPDPCSVGAMQVATRPVQWQARRGHLGGGPRGQAGCCCTCLEPALVLPANALVHVAALAQPRGACVHEGLPPGRWP